ncbi:hypothetical protein LOZ53_002579 [Ophidiomyces ophidiicola]|nr:hypothetical protein LOZ53_002579 [Ophidiomyces ophidiicola]
MASSSSATDTEETPLLPGCSHVPPGIKKRLYASHFLSTWNSRVFEFGAVLYLAAIFPNTLLLMSVYAFTRGAAATLLSPAFGRYVDEGDRLRVVRFSIVFQRFAVATSCVAFWFLASGRLIPRWLTWGILALLAVLACIEKLSSVVNLVCIEKDWVVVIAERNESALRGVQPSSQPYHRKHQKLTESLELNAEMRRIDLICKLIGPFVISMVDGLSTKIAILVNFGMNLASVIVEYYAIARVYDAVPALQQPKKLAETQQHTVEQTRSMRGGKYTKDVVRVYIQDVPKYCRHQAFLPSFAGALLYFTVLSFAGQMVTYLRSSGYNSVHVGAARTVSVILEIAATWTAPLIMSKIGPIRAGLWFVNWQILCLAGAAGIFWGVQDPLMAASGLVVGTILSRIGLRGFDLCAQIVVQEGVEAASRGSFSSIEASWQSFFELCSYTSTIVFFRPIDFQWPVLMSCTAVFLAGALYSCKIGRRDSGPERLLRRHSNSIASGTVAI